jgi:hypothetical protein
MDQEERLPHRNANSARRSNYSPESRPNDRTAFGRSRRGSGTCVYDFTFVTKATAHLEDLLKLAQGIQKSYSNGC